MFLIRRFAQMTRGGIAGFLTVVVLAGVAAFFWVARTINTAPAQCATCHPELTAMWKRSQGHPADRVTCHQCHAAHAEPPSSLNVGAFVRDQLIPEKYLGQDERIQGRCEGCHGDTRRSGTGRELAAAKSALREALGLAAHLDVEDRRIPLDPQGLAVKGRAVAAVPLLEASVRALRERGWRSAAKAAGIGENLEGLGDELAAMAQSLGAASLSEDLLVSRLGQPPPGVEGDAEPVDRDKVAAAHERITAAIQLAGAALGAVAAELPRTAATEAGSPVRIESASLRSLGDQSQPPAGPGTSDREPKDPESVTAAATAALASLGGATEGVPGLQYADLGVDADALGRVTERLGRISAAFALGGDAARARARAQQLLGTALAELPRAEAEDGLALEFALGANPAGASASVDLEALLTAAAAGFRERELAGERQKVIHVNHKLHLVSARDDLGKPLDLGCLSCHRSIAHDKRQVETNRPSMAGCFAGDCHRRDRNKDNCQRCHYQQLTEPGQQVL